ncbi:hypothetical protein [Parvibacter caecicola]|uniref:hypothetical protein n=1 Tax=Parvibacter caecicola TaxID=747645 RepID=UPI00249A01C5|nr:hypothetical protein [Parvibacter caecicola]
MERDFPHLGDTAFPHLSNVDVWKYRNNFDYGRWEDNARIKLCSVNWDSGYVNVVEWKTDAARDSFFDSLSGYKVDQPTMFQVQPDGSVKVPVPFNAATQYNYIVLEYPTMPTVSNPLENAAPARHRYYYFCEALEELAPSTTLCHVSLDVWTTYINSVSVSGMMLARGHAPMAAVTADAYLSNPRENCAYLEAPDVSYGGFERSNNAGSIVYNSEVWAVVSMTGNAKSSAWGSKAGNDWKTPADAFCGNSTPRAHAIAVEPTDLEAFVNAMISNTPQALQTVKAVWFAPKSLVNTGEAFTFAGVTVRELVLKTSQAQQLTKLSKELFGYDSRYSDMAKLYTYPYARIMVSDHDGQSTEIRIEETNGSVGAVAALDFVAPFVAITTQLTGIGGAGSAVTFANISEHTATIAGKAYETLRTWNIPTFEVYMSAAKVNDYATHFDRAQANTALQNAYTSATASNATANSNAKSSALAGRNNAFDSASASVRAATASSNTSHASTVSANVYAANQFSNAARQQAASMAQSVVQSFASLERNLEANTMQLATSATQNLVMGAVAGGAPGAAAGAAGAVFSGLSLATTISNNAEYVNKSAAISGDYMATMYGGSMIVDAPGSFQQMYGSYTGGSVESLVGESQFRTREQNSAQNVLARKLNKAQRQNSQNLVKGGSGYITSESGEVTANGTYTGTAVRSYSNAVEMADATKATADANAGRARSTALSAIENSIKQAALDAPMRAGSVSDAGKADTMPLGWFAWVETQGKGAIESAAAQFARYGYQLNQYWNFTGWQIMENFTYWQCDDVWVVPRECSQATASLIRSMLIEGTTVWRKPDIIGATSVWEN